MGLVELLREVGYLADDVDGMIGGSVVAPEFICEILCVSMKPVCSLLVARALVCFKGPCCISNQSLGESLFNSIAEVEAGCVQAALRDRRP
jgi:hypothetical protein